MTMTMALRNDVRVGVQIIIEGEKLEVQEFFVLISLFLRYAIPALTTLTACAGVIMVIISGIEDAFLAMSRIDLSPISRDFLTIYIGLCLAGILAGVMAKKR